MPLDGVYCRMEGHHRTRPFRNQARIYIAGASITYFSQQSARTELPTRWYDDTSFHVDWTPVCRRWGKAATFRAHVENEEQAQHFWRYEGAAAQNVQDNRRSHQARTPKSRPGPSRPTAASTPDDDVATAKTAALSSPSQRPGLYKTCLAAFDPAAYGREYLRLTPGDVIEDVEAPVAPEAWAYGSLVLPDGSRSAPGWYPHDYAQ